MSASIFADDFRQHPFWWETASPEEQAADELPETADVAIVGSGYAGLCCAIELATGGARVVVIEAGAIGQGASTRNAGFLSGRTGVSKQIDLQALVGADRAARIFAEADTAYADLQTRIADHGIDCHLDHVGRFVGAHTPKAYDRIARKLAEYNRDGDTGQYLVSRDEQHRYVDSNYWYGGMFIESAGTLHPSKYHRGLVEIARGLGVSLVANRRVLRITDAGERKWVETGHGDLVAREVVVATNGYTDALSPWHRKRLIPISSTIVASEPLGAERVAAMLPQSCPVIDTRRVICFARPTPDGERILFGGRARFAPLEPRESARILHGQLCKMFPQLADIRVTHTWSGLMAFTFDFLPKIGVHDGVHYALGCNGGCGIVMMSWLGKQVARRILGNAEGPSAFEGIEYQSRLFYSGRPWFIPLVGNWWRFRDWLEITRARHTPAAS